MRGGGAGPCQAASADDPASRAVPWRPTLAALAPESALEPIADALAATAEADAATRAALREALSLALGASPDGKLAALLSDAPPHPSRVWRSCAPRRTGCGASAGREQRDGGRARPGDAGPARSAALIPRAPRDPLARARDRAAAAPHRQARSRTMRRGPSERAARWRRQASRSCPGAHAAAAPGRVQATRVREAGAAGPRRVAVAGPRRTAQSTAASTLDKDRWPFVRAQAASRSSPGRRRRVQSSTRSRARSATARSMCAGRSAVVGLRAPPRRRALGSRDSRSPRQRRRTPPMSARPLAQALGAVCDLGSADRLDAELARYVGRAHGREEPTSGRASRRLVGLAVVAAERSEGAASRRSSRPSSPAHVRAAAPGASARRPFGLPLVTLRPRAAPSASISPAARWLNAYVIPHEHGPTRISPRGRRAKSSPKASPTSTSGRPKSSRPAIRPAP